MNKKRVLIIHETLNGGGAEKVLTEVLSHFDQSAYDVDLLLWEGAGIYKSQLPEGIGVFAVHEARMSFIHRLVMHLPEKINRRFQKRWIESALPSGEYDAIVSFMEGGAFRIHTFMLERQKSAKNISWVHCDIDKSHWSEGQFPYKSAAPYYGMLDTVVFVSEGAKESFLKIFPESEGQSYRVIYNIQEPEAIRTKGMEEKIDRPADRFIISSVGRLEREKRFDRVIDIAALAKEKGLPFEFWILGSGSLEAELHAYCKRRGVEDRVKFLGFQTNPYAYIAASDVFLLTSESEGYGLVVGEAMSLGVPVVSTKVIGPLDLLKNGEGILCDETPEELLEALRSLYVSEELRKHYSERGLEKSKDFDPDNTMKQIYSIL